MGVFAKEAEVSTPLPPAKVFKAFVVDLDTLMPKVAPQAINSVELLQRDGGPGTIKKITFAEDKDNLLYTYVVIESDFFNNVVEKISYETKFVAVADGGTSIKISPDLMLQIKEASEKRALVLKAIENCAGKSVEVGQHAALFSQKQLEPVKLLQSKLLFCFVT
ncbi:hypothetical protein ES319_D02G065400v1 [Gossypium barbadense]|uniref:Bet v I/Major latex protein domain-containing protein n=2 Tax=Gossypium TaxID=3633 RepID=A0A5J5S9B1_GOSBA|nr:hypothetical protein ES319_D02G065400v1 [Gossypium barbadense]TYG78567.1 hypothetical protein ES288_D02G069600v1 [Gossypium darwinii]